MVFFAHCECAYNDRVWLPGHYGPAGGVDHQPVGRERGPQLHGVAVGRGSGAEPEGHHEGEEDGSEELNVGGNPQKYSWPQILPSECIFHLLLELRKAMETTGGMIIEKLSTYHSCSWKKCPDRVFLRRSTAGRRRSSGPIYIPKKHYTTIRRDLYRCRQQAKAQRWASTFPWDVPSIKTKSTAFWFTNVKISYVRNIPYT